MLTGSSFPGLYEGRELVKARRAFSGRETMVDVQRESAGMEAENDDRE